MSRLQTEQARLYRQVTSPDDQTHFSGLLTTVNSSTRVLVISLHTRIGWEPIATFWQGIQDELGWPTPALAVSGVNSYQIWFSLAEPASIVDAQNVLQWLRERFLAAIDARNIRTYPALESEPMLKTWSPHWIPAVQTESGYWSAYVAHGLASLFCDEPWLDRPPSPDAQADLLSRLQSISPADWARVQEIIHAASRSKQPTSSASACKPCNSDVALDRSGPLVPHKTGSGCLTPTSFLLQVINDPAVEISLRIDAAKALLPFFGTQQP